MSHTRLHSQCKHRALPGTRTAIPCPLVTQANNAQIPQSSVPMARDTPELLPFPRAPGHAHTLSWGIHLLHHPTELDPHEYVPWPPAFGGCSTHWRPAPTPALAGTTPAPACAITASISSPRDVHLLSVPDRHNVRTTPALLDTPGNSDSPPTHATRTMPHPHRLHTPLPSPACHAPPATGPPPPPPPPRRPPGAPAPPPPAPRPAASPPARAACQSRGSGPGCGTR